MTVAPDEPAGPADRELDDLIVRHLDGGLDPAGQRRLADLLASSAEARRTLAEGATLRLAAAGLLGAGVAVPTEVAHPSVPETMSTDSVPTPRAAARDDRSPSGWLRPVSLTLAAGLLTALVLSQALPRVRGRDGADIDRIADGWLAARRDATTAAGLPSDAPPNTTFGVEAGTEAAGTADDPPDGGAMPPAWLVAALTDDAAQPPAPDEG
jgi:hypothetical protein